jgi:pimeloyl-ACP methyl ester carboxylesterase
MKLFISSLLSCLLMMHGGPVHAVEPPSANDVFRSAGKIVSPDGIDEQKLVTIGGIQQWVSIRGRHRDSPILLLLHGGPGFTTIPSSYYFLRSWEEYFTVVQWDQRGAGKTYVANDPAAIRPTLSIDRLVADAAELTSYLRQTYGRKRIVLAAHSFGTVIGVKLAQRHPEWFYAYLSMGQLVNTSLNEKLGYDATLAAARADKNTAAITALEAIAPFPDVAHPERNAQNLSVERRWLAYYGGYYWHDNVGHEDDLDRFSPDYTADELKKRYEAMGFGIQILWDEAGKVDFTSITHFDCPVIFFEGRHDLGTNASLLSAWYKTIHAPKKQLVWFEDSAHMVYQEEPGKVLVTLVSHVLPLAR